MSYSEDIASQYQAYRPPLHEIILSKILPRKFHNALDVGCGTGISSMALTEFADSITGLEPSQDMLQAAAKHPRITYKRGVLPDSSLPSGHFDLISFAGSINYCLSSEVYADMIRLLGPDGFVVVYDFNIHLNPVTGVNYESDYNHRLNWDSLNGGELELLKEMDELYELRVSRDEFLSLCRAEEVLRDIISEEELLARVNFSETVIGADLIGTLYKLR